MTSSLTNDQQPTRVEVARAKAMHSAAHGRDIVLPRYFYEVLEIPAPDNATDRLQRDVQPKFESKGTAPRRVRGGWKTRRSIK